LKLKRKGSVETVYFVPSDGEIRTFIDFDGGSFGEIDLTEYSIWGWKCNRADMYNLSQREISPERNKRIKESKLGKFLTQK